MSLTDLFLLSTRSSVGAAYRILTGIFQKKLTVLPVLLTCLRHDPSRMAHMSVVAYTTLSAFSKARNTPSCAPAAAAAATGHKPQTLNLGPKPYVFVSSFTACRGKLATGGERHCQSKRRDIPLSPMPLAFFVLLCHRAISGWHVDDDHGHKQILIAAIVRYTICGGQDLLPPGVLAVIASMDSHYDTLGMRMCGCALI